MFANLTNSGIGSSTGPHMLVGSGMSGGQMCAALFPAADVLLTALPLPLPLPLPSQTCFFVCRVVHLPTALLFPALLQSPCPWLSRRWGWEWRWGPCCCRCVREIMSH